MQLLPFNIDLFSSALELKHFHELSHRIPVLNIIKTDQNTNIYNALDVFVMAYYISLLTLRWLR